MQETPSEAATSLMFTADETGKIVGELRCLLVHCGRRVLYDAWTGECVVPTSLPPPTPPSTHPPTSLVPCFERVGFVPITILADRIHELTLHVHVCMCSVVCSVREQAANQTQSGDVAAHAEYARLRSRRRAGLCVVLCVLCACVYVVR